MDLLQALGILEGSEKFRVLPFPEQANARRRVVEKFGSTVPGYDALPPKEKVNFMKRVAFRPPVMETPQGIERIETAKTRLASFTKAEGLTKGNIRDQLRAVPGLMAGNWESTASTLVGMEKESFVFGFRRVFAQWMPSYTYKLLKGILGENHPQTQSVKRLAEWTPAHFRDADKWESWVDTTLSEGKQYRELNHGLTKGVGKIAVNIGELGLMSAVSASALGMSSMGAGATTRLGSAFGKGLKFTKFGVDTGTEFTREIVKSWEQDPERKYTLDQMVSTFGQTVAWNMIGVTAAKALGTMVRPLKYVFGGFTKGWWDTVDTMGRGVNPERLAQIYDDVFTGRAIDPQLFANMGKAEQRAVRVWENAVNVAKNVEARTPENMLGVVAGVNGYQMTGLPNGRYVLTPFVEGLEPKSFASFPAVEKWFAGEIAANVQRTAKDSAATIAASANLRLDYGSDWANALAIKRHGSGLLKTPEGWVLNTITDEGDMVPLTFKDLRQAGDFLLKDSVKDGFVDSALAPDGAVLIEGSKALRYVDTVATGNRRDIYNHLAIYRDDAVYKAREVLFKQGEQTVQRNLNHLEVVDEVTGVRAEFNDPESMISWLKTSEDDLLKARDIAARKGYRLEPYAGRWYAYAEDGQPLQFDTVEDALKGLETVRIPEYAPELTGIDSRVAASMSPKVALVDHVWKERDIPTRDLSNATYNFRTTDSVVEKAVRKLGAPEDLAKDFGSVIVAREAHEAYRSVGYDAIHQAFSPMGQKMISRKTAADLHLMLRQDTRVKAMEMLGKINKHRGGKAPLGEQYLEIWDRVNAFRGGPGTGLSGFGQIGERMAEGSHVLGYVPELYEKVKDFVARNPTRHFGNDAMKILTEAGVNEKYLPFFRHARMDDIVELAKVADPITAFERVYDIIAREKFLAPALDRLEKGVNKAAKVGALNSNMADYLKDFINVAYGRVKEVDYKTLRSDLARSVAKPFAAMGLVPKETSSFIDLAISLSYSSSLGFRPYPVVRNMISQLLTLIGPTMGFDYLGRAMKTLGHPGELLETVAMLRRKGILLGEGHANVGVDLALPKGLGGIRRSDDYSRAVAWLTTKYRFDEAQALVERGKIKDIGTFLKRSGLGKMSVDVQKAAVEHVKAGNWDAAHDLFARRYTFETLFPFANAYNPRYLKKQGVVGRLFGQFGTFSGWYVDAIARYGFERGDWMDKIGFAGRLAAGTGVASAAAAAMGLRWARDWAPWGPAMFSGGPYFDLVTTSLNLMKPGYPGRQARAEMFGITEEGGLPKIDPLKAWNAQATRLLLPLPGRVQLDYFAKTAKYLEQGDAYRAILSALSAPVNPVYDH